MGPWLVLVSLCFRENVVATCKIESFLCSLDNLLQKNVIVVVVVVVVVFFFWNQIKSNGAHLKKKGYFWPTFHISHFLVTKKSYENSFRTNLTHIHKRSLLTLLPYQFWKKYEFIRYGFSLVWVLVLIRICAILEQSINNKMVSKS